VVDWSFSKADYGTRYSPAMLNVTVSQVGLKISVDLSDKLNLLDKSCAENPYDFKAD
jgi:hypothetical protein